MAGSFADVYRYFPSYGWLRIKSTTLRKPIFKFWFLVFLRCFKDILIFRVRIFCPKIIDWPLEFVFFWLAVSFQCFCFDFAADISFPIRLCTCPKTLFFPFLLSYHSSTVYWRRSSAMQSLCLMSCSTGLTLELFVSSDVCNFRCSLPEDSFRSFSRRRIYSRFWLSTLDDSV